MLDEAEPAGDTALVDGAYAAMVVGESDVGRALLIVFSDGLDTSSRLHADAVLDTAKRSDVVAYAVSVGRVKSAFLRDLTSFTGGRLFEIEKTANLSAIFVSVLEEFRHRCLVSYTPRGVATDGWASPHGAREAKRDREGATRIPRGIVRSDHAVGSIDFLTTFLSFPAEARADRDL